MLIFALIIFFSVLIMVIKTAEETSFVKLRYYFFMFMSKRGFKNCAKKLLMGDKVELPTNTERHL